MRVIQISDSIKLSIFYHSYYSQNHLLRKGLKVTTITLTCYLFHSHLIYNFLNLITFLNALITFSILPLKLSLLSYPFTFTHLIHFILYFSDCFYSHFFNFLSFFLYNLSKFQLFPLLLFLKTIPTISLPKCNFSQNKSQWHPKIIDSMPDIIYDQHDQFIVQKIPVIWTC